VSPEKLYTDILLGLEALHLTSKQIKKPKGVLQAVEVFQEGSPLGRVYLRSKSVHLRVRGARRTEPVSSVTEAAALLVPTEVPVSRPTPMPLSEALAAFGKGDIEAAQEKARAVLDAAPGNEAARRLLEKCEKLLRAERAGMPGEVEVAEKGVGGPETPEGEAAPPEEPDEEHAVVAEQGPGMDIPVEEVPVEEVQVEEPLPSAPPVAPVEAVQPPLADTEPADWRAEVADHAAVAEEPRREEIRPPAAPAPPAARAPQRRRWTGFVWVGLVAVVVLVLVFALRGRKEEAAPSSVPETEVVSPEENRRDRLAQTADRARRMETAGRFWGGEESAGALYAAVLAEEPSSPSARVGALRVADTLRSLADSAFAGANFANATSQYEAVAELLQRCLQVVPRDSAFRRRYSEVRDLPGLSELRAELFRSMVYVAPGAFVRGDNDGPLDSRPQRQLSLGEFWIDRYEVTNEQYSRFVQATGRARPPQWPDSGLSAEIANKPVVSVTWSDAAAFARWAGKRLPTEAEWEKAARGTNGNRYPWGSRFSAELCNTIEGGVQGVAAVGSYSRGASPYGVSEMAGNVREWTADFYDGRYYITGPVRDPRGPRGGVSRVVRGGSWRLSREWALTFARSRLRPDEASSDLGFRCASDKGPLPMGDPASTPVTE
jgi:sulfatase modifying factor 1